MRFAGLSREATVDSRPRIAAAASRLNVSDPAFARADSRGDLLALLRD